ncbi:MAG TPA: NIPSNAP family protein [Thermodesulfobacteriota bacterium]|nr:NIPSNAP family protein [Thermodesulfobacteriota bacterium]
MYYFVSFDPKEGAGRKQIVDAYNKFAKHFEKKLPQFKLIGLYARNVLLGSRPHYIAIWEFPNYSDLEEWNKAFANDKQGQKLAKSLGDLATGWEAKVMSKLI